MSLNFLAHFTELARRVTGAERAFAVTADLQVCGYSAMDESALKAGDLRDFAFKTLQEAIRTQEAIFTNNLIHDMTQAPTTNTNLGTMRFVVALPVPPSGAIYLDQPIRSGVIAREAVEKLHSFAQRALLSELADGTLDDLEQAFDA